MAIYLYHLVPKDLKGNILYPLNKLKERHPDTYREQIRKYIGREHITKQRIPILNCLWNDVLHFSSVDPKEIKEALIQAGKNPDFTMSYYQIDAHSIESANAIIYLNRNIGNKMDEENFIEYSPNEVEKLSKISHITKNYYRKIIEKGKYPLLYHRVPHILYKSEINITNTPIISV